MASLITAFWFNQEFSSAFFGIILEVFSGKHFILRSLRYNCTSVFWFVFVVCISNFDYISSQVVVSLCKTTTLHLFVVVVNVFGMLVAIID